MQPVVQDPIAKRVDVRDLMDKAHSFAVEQNEKAMTEAARHCSLAADRICEHISSNKVAPAYTIEFTLPDTHEVSCSRLEKELKRVLCEAGWRVTRVGVSEAPEPGPVYPHRFEVPKFRLNIAISWPDKMNDKVSAEIANSWK
ncbi:hypothetical protein HDU90_003443 [Geranomyces variabilis]|nr:hypothetical protein HDU90_003443 [Geranomyces variabilis]